MSDWKYRAVCDKCGHVQRVNDDTKFLDPFFLPTCCPKCGDTKSKYTNPTGWNVEQGRYVYKKPQHVWNDMSTWTSRLEWESYDEDAALKARMASQ